MNPWVIIPIAGILFGLSIPFILYGIFCLSYWLNKPEKWESRKPEAVRKVRKAVA